MKFFQDITGLSASKPIREIIEKPTWANRLLREVCGKCLGVDNPTGRPAEFRVEMPNYTIPTGRLDEIGFAITLREVTVGSRSLSQLHKAQKTLQQLMVGVVNAAYNDTENPIRIQIFASIELDEPVETAPGSGQRSRLLESDPEWIEFNPFAEDDTAEGDFVPAEEILPPEADNDPSERHPLE